MRWAIVQDGIVTNIVLWNGQEAWQPPVGATIIALHETVCDIGWIFDGTGFSPPAGSAED